MDSSHRSKARLAALAVCAVLAMVLTGCSTASSPKSTSGASTSSAAEAQPLKIGILAPFQATDYLNLVADQEGFFAKNGIIPNFVTVPQNPIAPLLSGDLNIAPVGVNGLSAVQQGQPVKFVDAVLSRLLGAVVVPKGSPLVKDAHNFSKLMQGLKGKTLGTTVPGALYDNVGKALVADAHLTGQIKVVAAGTTPAAAAGVQSGVFNAALLPSPVFETLIAQGSAVSVLDLYKGEGPDLGVPNLTSMMSATFTKAHPALITDYQRAIQEANDWARSKKNTKALTVLVAAKLNVSQSSIAQSINTFQTALGTSINYTKAQWAAALKLDKQSGLITKSFAYSDYVIPFKG